MLSSSHDGLKCFSFSCQMRHDCQKAGACVSVACECELSWAWGHALLFSCSVLLSCPSAAGPHSVSGTLSLCRSARWQSLTAMRSTVRNRREGIHFCSQTLNLAPSLDEAKIHSLVSVKAWFCVKGGSGLSPVLLCPWVWVLYVE